MHKIFKYRLYPTRHQITLLNQTLEICRQVYNKTLGIRKDSYEKEKKSLSLYDTHKLLPIWKKEVLEWKNVNAQVLQNVQARVDLAYKAFFRRVKSGQNPGYPRFKGYGRYDSFTYPQAYQKGIKLVKNGILINKIGLVSVVFHRPIQGKIKTVTIWRSNTGKWYTFINVEVDPVRLPCTDLVVGIDLGLSNFAVLSNENVVENPKFFKKLEKRLARVQRKFSKLKKGSKEKKKFRKVVAKVYEKITNQRKDFAHKLSRDLVNRFGVIVFEDLDITDMIQDKRFSKSINDVPWGQFVRYVSYKAEEAGRNVVLVNPKNTSKMCSQCGNIKEDLELKDRIYVCRRCGLVLDRDYNASLNILVLGLQHLEQASSK